MPKNNEFANKVNSSNHVSTSAHETGKCVVSLEQLPKTQPQEITTYLTEKNIVLLKQMFSDEAKYIEYMETLWALRDLAGKSCETQNEKCLEYDVNSPYFRIVKLTNELIGALIQDGIYFRVIGKEVCHWRI